MNERISVIAIFDVGKTNKKLLLFDEGYEIVFEENVQLSETKDEDGFPCEDVYALSEWVRKSFDEIQKDPRFEIKAINYSAYGASLVYLDGDRNIVGPLYNYLKPFPPALLQKFYREYGGESYISKVTASPVLGNLNSGMQLYRLKYEKPEAFEKIKYALHLPQYLCFLLTSSLHADITSVGCHTNLWNFEENRYHEWVQKENIKKKFPPLLDSNEVAGYVNDNIPSGAGLHDSSSALIPYHNSYDDPFVLISTGTWCISLNPFNHSILTEEELKQDCLCYLAHNGKPVKASRIFAGNEHEKQIRDLAKHFSKPLEYYLTVKVDENFIQPSKLVRHWKDCKSYEEAYHLIMSGIIMQQIASTDHVLKGTSVKRIFVDGGFSKNALYMYLLKKSYPEMEILAATVPQASALGAALAFHNQWNKKNPLYADKGC